MASTNRFPHASFPDQVDFLTRPLAWFLNHGTDKTPNPNRKLSWV